MRLLIVRAGLLCLSVVAACGSDSTTTCCTTGQASLRVVNAFTSPVDVLVDGNVAIGSLAPGEIGTAAPNAGSHSVAFRASGGVSAAQTITSAAGDTNTIAAVRASTGSVSSVAVDDTGSIVPAGKTKVRVIHFAPNAGVLQVYRTQPDYQHPVQWQFPFTYQGATPPSISAPFIQSSVGSWEVRVWQTPADSTGWATTPVKVVIPLKSGEKKTVFILDKPGGGVRVELM